MPFQLYLRFRWRVTPLSTHTQFGCDRSPIKSTLLREQSTFKAVSWLPFEGISCNFILLIFDAYAPNNVILVARNKKWRALYWKNKVPFLLHFGFRWNFISHTVHKCTRTSVGLVFTLRTSYFFSCKSASIRGIFLKLHTSHFPHMH